MSRAAPDREWNPRETLQFVAAIAHRAGVASRLLPRVLRAGELGALDMNDPAQRPRLGEATFVGNLLKSLDRLQRLRLRHLGPAFRLPREAHEQPEDQRIRRQGAVSRGR